jgi:hypothetical protein
LSSCLRDDDPNNEVIEQNITLINSENYEYQLARFGDEAGAEIKV